MLRSRLAREGPAFFLGAFLFSCLYIFFQLLPRSSKADCKYTGGGGGAGGGGEAAAVILAIGSRGFFMIGVGFLIASMETVGEGGCMGSLCSSKTAALLVFFFFYVEKQSEREIIPSDLS